MEEIKDLYECECDCDCEDEDDDDYGYIEMECPYCGELVEIDEDELYDDDLDIVCPNCEKVILSSEDFDDVDPKMDAVHAKDAVEKTKNKSIFIEK